jgi:putative phosphoribosyl transferase
MVMGIFHKQQVETPPEVVDDPPGTIRRSVLINVDPVRLPGDLVIPGEAIGIVAFAHGSGSSRKSPRNVMVADRLHEASIGTLLFDLLTPAEAEDRDNVFDIDLLARRLEGAHRWLRRWPAIGRLPLGFFGASTGAGAALVAAARLGAEVAAVVSRGGRPDLAGDVLAKVRVPTLLIVGGADPEVLAMNREALERLRGEKQLEVVADATHLFEEPGALEEVARLAGAWFARTLPLAGDGRRVVFTGLEG